MPLPASAARMIAISQRHRCDGPASHTAWTVAWHREALQLHDAVHAKASLAYDVALDARRVHPTFPGEGIVFPHWVGNDTIRVGDDFDACDVCGLEERRVHREGNRRRDRERNDLGHADIFAPNVG